MRKIMLAIFLKPRLTALSHIICLAITVFMCGVSLHVAAKSFEVKDACRVHKTSRYCRALPITGVVLNDEGAKLAGVSVQLQGTNIGTATDKNGRFSLNAETGDILMFTAVGYKDTMLAVTTQRNINVVLSKDAVGLDDVVVIGYGKQKKITTTGAISQVSGADVRRTPGASLQNMLAGKLPGYFSVQRSGQPGGDAAQFFIRGISTFSDNNQRPLVMVDDIEYDYDQLAKIDPSEIESVTILKDAGTTAIYGIKGANGVILVTTRRGKTGKPVISLKSQLGAQIPVKPMQFLNAYETARLRNQALINSGFSPQFSDEDLELFKNGEDPYRHPDIDWYNTLIRRNSLMTTNNIDVSGGTDKVKYFASLGYLWQNGNLKDFKTPSIYPDDNINNNYYYKRYNFRSNLDIIATRSLSFKLDLTGNYEEKNAPAYVGKGVFYEIAHYEQLPPYAYNIYNPDGSYGFSDGSLVPQPAEGNANNIIGRLAMSGYNRNFGNQITVNASGIQKLDDLVKGLSLRATVSYTSTNTSTRTESRGNAFPSFAYYEQTGLYVPRDPNIYRVSPLSLTYGGGTPVRRVTVQGALNYLRIFGRHTIGSLLLYNQSSDAESSNPYNRLSDYIPSKLRGYTYRLTYNFSEKYLFEASGAYNGSNRFITQNRYGFFPSVSAGYNLSKENFFSHVFPFFDLLKFRGSWGITGDDQVSGGRYIFEEVYNTTSGITYFGETPNSSFGVSEGTLGNKNVTWQKERKTNLGVDFSLFKGAVSGQAEYFDNYRYDILRTRGTVPLFFGISGIPPVNLGKVCNKGFELTLTHKGQVGHIHYNITGIFSYAKNKILQIDEPPALYPWLQQTGTSIGTSRMWIWEGYYHDSADVANSPKPSGNVKPGYLKYKDLNGDGIINDLDRGYFGDPNIPNKTYSANLGFSYKGFSVNALFQGASGYNFNIGWRLATPFKANLQPIHQNSWTPELGDNASFPLLISDFNGTYMSPTDVNLSTFWSVTSWYIKFRSFEMAYDLPQHFVKKAALTNARVFLSAYNLLTWSNIYKKYQYDPETSTIGQGEDNVYPQQRIFNLGLNISF